MSGDLISAGSRAKDVTAAFCCSHTGRARPSAPDAGTTLAWSRGLCTTQPSPPGPCPPCAGPAFFPLPPPLGLGVAVALVHPSTDDHAPQPTPHPHPTATTTMKLFSRLKKSTSARLSRSKSKSGAEEEKGGGGAATEG